MPLYPNSEGMYLEIDEDKIPALRENQDSVYERAARATWLTEAEKRVMTGWDEDERFDVWLVPTNRIPVDSNGDQAQATGQAAAPAIAHKASEIDPLPFATTDEDSRVRLWKTIDQRRERAIQRSNVYTARQMVEVHKAVKAAMAGATDAVELGANAAGAVLAMAPTWEKVLTEQVWSPTVFEFAEQTLVSLKGDGPEGTKQDAEDYEDIGLSGQWVEEINDYISTNVGSHVTDITTSQREAIRSIVDKGLIEGQGVRELRQAIDALYLDSLIPNRSTVIARTETMQAANYGSFTGARSTGLPLLKEWIATKDGHTRDAHRDADGQKVKLNDPYTVGGENLLHPLDASMGASASNIIQCRCAEGYAVDRGGS